MRFWLFSQQAIVGLIFDMCRMPVGKVLSRWANKWALVGQNLCCLDITRDYLGKEVPNVNLDLGKPNLVFHHGKDWLICPKHNDNAIMKCTYSSKNERDATRGIMWSTVSGLVFETTSFFSGQAGERALVRLYCLLGNKCASIEKWEDIWR